LRVESCYGDVAAAAFAAAAAAAVARLLQLPHAGARVCAESYNFIYIFAQIPGPDAAVNKQVDSLLRRASVWLSGCCGLLCSCPCQDLLSVVVAYTLQPHTHTHTQTHQVSHTPFALRFIEILIILILIVEKMACSHWRCWASSFGLFGQLASLALQRRRQHRQTQTQTILTVFIVS